MGRAGEHFNNISQVLILLLLDRNYKQLKDHYENYLRPNLKKGEWTVEDDLLLINLIN